jgi:hypothetical protein
MRVANKVSSTGFLWWMSGWLSGLPHRTAGLDQLLKLVRSMSLSDFVDCVNDNLDNIVLGKPFWGGRPLDCTRRAEEF